MAQLGPAFKDSTEYWLRRSVGLKNAHALGLQLILHRTDIDIFQL